MIFSSQTHLSNINYARFINNDEQTIISCTSVDVKHVHTIRKSISIFELSIGNFPSVSSFGVFHLSTVISVFDLSARVYIRIGEKSLESLFSNSCRWKISSRKSRSFVDDCLDDDRSSWSTFGGATIRSLTFIIR